MDATTTTTTTAQEGSSPRLIHDNSAAKAFERQLVAAYQQFSQQGAAGLDALEALYDPYVVFRDPLRTLHGRDPLIDLHRRLAARFASVRVGITTMALCENTLFVAWTMTLLPRRSPLPIVIEGASQAHVRDGKIVYQRDYWDVMGSVAHSLPWVGALYERTVALLGG